MISKITNLKTPRTDLPGRLSASKLCGNLQAQLVNQLSKEAETSALKNSLVSISEAMTCESRDTCIRKNTVSVTGPGAQLLQENTIAVVDDKALVETCQKTTPQLRAILESEKMIQYGSINAKLYQYLTRQGLQQRDNPLRNLFQT